MADFESFSAPESVGQGSSAESFRVFQEKMKVAAAQIKAIKAGEQKQKKKEEELSRILANFIKSQQGTAQIGNFLAHISKLLALNCPAAFILAVLLLDFPELQVETGFLMISYEEAMKAGALEGNTLPDLYMREVALTPAMKIAIDAWLQEIAKVAFSVQHKLAVPPFLIQKQWHAAIADFLVFSLDHYLNMHQFSFDLNRQKQFIDLFLADLAEKILQPLPELT